MKKFLFFLVIFLSTTLWLSAQPMAGTYKIGNGMGSNYTKLQDALNVLHILGASYPVVFELMDSYNPDSEEFPVIFSSFAGASTTNTLTVKPALNANINIEKSTTNEFTTLFTIVDASHIIIDGSHNGTDSKNLSLTNTHQLDNVAVIGTLVSTTAGEDITVKNCILKGAGQSFDNIGFFNGGFSDIKIYDNAISQVRTGILSDGGSDLLFDKNEIGSDIENEYVALGIGLQASADFVVSNNHIFNLNSALEHNTYGIFTENSTGAITISGNKLENLTHTGTQTAQALAFLNLNAENLNIINNHISGVASDSYSDNFPTGIALHCPEMTTGISILNNTIYLPENNSLGIGTGASNVFSSGISIGAGTGIVLKNNIIVNQLGERNGATEITFGVAIVTDLPSSPFAEIDNNVYLCESNCDVSVLAWTIFGTKDLEDWQTWTGGDAHSFYENPLFVSETDLSLQACSPAVAHATPDATVSADILGATRHASYPSIGAYEYEMQQACYVGQILLLKSEALMTWTPGNGCHAAVFAKKGDFTAEPPTPQNGTSYMPAYEYGLGDQIGTSGWFCISNAGSSDINETFFYGELGEPYTVFVSEYFGTLENEVYLTDICTNNPFVVYPDDGGNIKTTAAEFELYPTLVFDVLNIKNTSNFEKTSVEILDVRGSVLIKQTIESKTINTLNLSNLNSGIYFVKLSSDSDILTQKIVKN